MLKCVVCRQQVGVGVRLGVRRGLGRRHLPVRRRRAAAVRQGERGALLQGAESEYPLRELMQPAFTLLLVVHSSCHDP